MKLPITSWEKAIYKIRETFQFEREKKIRYRGKPFDSLRITSRLRAQTAKPLEGEEERIESNHHFFFVKLSKEGFLQYSIPRE